MICDSDLKIINANARYPGSSNDSLIGNNSNIFSTMKEFHCRYPYQYFLLFVIVKEFF
jgi:hypothetical protein